MFFWFAGAPSPANPLFPGASRLRNEEYLLEASITSDDSLTGAEISHRRLRGVSASFP